MSKLHLVIADNDTLYLHSLINFLMSCYNQRFNVASFTEEPCLKEYLDKCDTGVDILLLGTGFTECEFRKENVKTVIFLSEENSRLPKDHNVLNRYQQGDLLVGRILELFSESNPDNYYLSDGSKKTRIIAVYSPVGGIGKTTIAVGLCIQSAWEGKTVFYLNLEEMPSTNLFFEGTQDQNLSNVLFHLKNRTKNYTGKIEMAKSTDLEYKVSFFQPPDSVLDLKEELSEELQDLMTELTKTRQYDRIFIDMSSCLDNNNLKILENCDDILVICNQDAVSGRKISAMLNEFNLLSQGRNIHLIEKVSFILNNYQYSVVSDESDDDIGGKSIILKIPKVLGLMIPYGQKYRLDMNSDFGAAMHQLSARI